MKSIANDMIRMFEFGKTFNKPAKTPVRKKKEELADDADIVALYLKRRRQAEELKAALDNIAKMDKKEEKKDDKKKEGMSAPAIMLWMIALFPITGPLYIYFVASMLNAVRALH